MKSSASKALFNTGSNLCFYWVLSLNLLTNFNIFRNPPTIRRRFVRGPPVIRLLPITNCSNRRFYRLAVTRQNSDLSDEFIEDLGSIDPMPNKDNQILVALNIERIKYHLSKSVPIKGQVGPILGLAGLLPVHPTSYLAAYRNRRKLEEKNKNKAEN